VAVPFFTVGARAITFQPKAKKGVSTSVGGLPAIHAVKYVMNEFKVKVGVMNDRARAEAEHFPYGLAVYEKDWEWKGEKGKSMNGANFARGVKAVWGKMLEHHGMENEDPSMHLLLQQNMEVFDLDDALKKAYASLQEKFSGFYDKAPRLWLTAGPVAVFAMEVPPPFSWALPLLPRLATWALRAPPRLLASLKWVISLWKAKL